MSNFHDILQETIKDISKEREKWIIKSLKANSHKVVGDLQEFINKNNVHTTFDAESYYTKLYIGNELIGKFNEKPKFIQYGNGFKFKYDYWIKKGGKLIEDNYGLERY